MAFQLGVSGPDTAIAQTMPFDEPTEIATRPLTGDFGIRSGSLVAAPVPFESPSLGTGLALGAGYLFQADSLSDTSSFGAAGFKSSNGSYGYGLGLDLSWDQDRWTARLLAAEADLNYDLYLSALKVPVSQSLSGARLQLGHSPRESFTFGSNVDYGKYRLSSRSGGLLPEQLQPEARLTIARLGFFAEYDTSDDSFYPSRGEFAGLKLTHGEFIDLERPPYTKAVVTGRVYRPVLADGVLAANAVACLAEKNAPFFDSCALGATDGFRGYVSTEFIDRALVSLQTEYRGRLTDRFGYVLFAGAGSVEGSIGKSLAGHYRTAAGLGLRIRLSKAFPLDYAIDLSHNDRSETLLYVSVGQRF